MMHRQRNGRRIICYWCKQRMHGYCVNRGPEEDQVIYCHCNVCVPGGKCDDEECMSKTLRLTKRPRGSSRWKHDDPRWE